MAASAVAWRSLVTETPASFTIPIVQVERIGGASRFTLDQPRVDITTFAPDRQSSLNLAEQVRMLMEQTLPGTRVGSASFGAVFCDSGPSWAPWDNTNVRRFVASYQMAVHASQ